MAAFPLAAVLALALDQVRRYSGWALWVVRLVLLMAVAKNTLWMSSHSKPWSNVVAGERRTLQLVAGSDLTKTADPNRRPLQFSPDVMVSSIDQLVGEHAVTPVTAQTDAEIALFASALATELAGSAAAVAPAPAVPSVAVEAAR